MAGITNVTHYPNAIPASRKMIADVSVFPSDAEMSGYFTIGEVPQAAERLRTRLWARFKAGN
jgi:putrescine transport system substrate-binding protein